MKKLEPMEADHSKLKANFCEIAFDEITFCEMISQPSCSLRNFAAVLCALKFSEYICCLNPNSLLVIHQLDDSLVVKQEYRQPLTPGDFLSSTFYLTRLGMNQNGAVAGDVSLLFCFLLLRYCNLCMPYWIRDQEGRLVRIENPQDTELDICVNIMDPPLEDQNSQQGQVGNPNAYLSMRDRMHPPRMSAPSCIVPPLEQLVIRPHIVPLLPNFHRMENENPYAHIKEFEEVCNTFREGGASIDLMRLKLFPFTLKDKAKIWLNSLRPRSIRNWIDLQPEFLKKYFPTHRTTLENEKFHECWERYMEAINACPHHGFDTWLLVSYFMMECLLP
ncbi:hypothetical protein AAG906_020800 [Vitis piasezkii]